MSASMDQKKSNLNALQADVDETKKILTVTVDKLVDRSERLDALAAKAEDLTSSSIHFHRSSVRIKQKTKWQNYKMTIALVAVVIIIITVIVIVIVVTTKK